MNEKLQELKQKANKLPLDPGVYIMKDKSGKIIYVGKAKALKNRVTQYFGKGTQHTEKVAKMVSLVDSFEYIITSSEFEALILENSLIKQHQPKYNILHEPVQYNAQYCHHCANYFVYCHNSVVITL